MNLINGDCIQEIPKLIKQGISVDLTITSPPYDNLRVYNNTLSWNKNIWKSIIQKLYGITKEGGVVVWITNDATIGGSETGTSFEQALYFKDIGFRLHDTMIYAKNNFVPLNHNRYEQSFEYMFIFSKGAPKTTNLFREKTKKSGMRVNRKRTQREYENDSMRFRDETNYIKNSKIKGNIWYYTVGKNYGEGNKHPAIFPEDLVRDHILSWSNEGDIVFDPMMGSGTTGAMAKRLNRDFIGIEKFKEYYIIANKRIKETSKRLF